MPPEPAPAAAKGWRQQMMARGGGKNRHAHSTGKQAMKKHIWLMILAAASIILISFGVRLTSGLLVHPLMNSARLTIAQTGLIFAVAQLAWGMMQPVFGSCSDRGFGLSVLLAGMMCIVSGEWLTLYARGFWLVMLGQGLLVPAGIAAASLAPLMSIVGPRLPQAKLAFASGIINSGGSLGQFILAPIVQLLLDQYGMMGAITGICLIVLLMLLPAVYLCRPGAGAPQDAPKRAAEPAVGLGTALKSRDYILLDLGFFTCGFHVAFLSIHLPSEVMACGHTAAVSAASLSIIGLTNIAGSIGAGYLSRFFQMKYILASIYGARALMIYWFMASAKTEADFYLFSALTGFTWLATVPPTLGLVAKLFGRQSLGSIFGCSFLTHQIGGFLGAWLGGLALQWYGNLSSIWYVDISLALLAAVFNLPIRENTAAGAPHPS